MTYEYKCTHCVTVFERHMNIADHVPVVPCPSCGADAEQYFSSERRFDVYFLGHEGWDSTGGKY